MTDIRTITKDNVDEVHWPQQASESCRAAQAYLPLVREGVGDYISNADVEMQLMLLDDIALPITIHNTSKNVDSYVCSPLCQYGVYPQGELSHLPSRLQQRLFSVVLAGLTHFLRWTSIDRVVHPNNWLLSTNLYPSISEKQFTAIHQCVLENYPRHAIVWRSINPRNHAAMIRHATELGYQCVASRRIYFQDASTGNPFKTPSYKRDIKLFEKQGYCIQHITAPTDAMIDRIVQLYRMLYIGKYSVWNPQFTDKFIARLVASGFLHCYALTNPDGRIDGVVGYYTQNGIMTTPLLGYDLTIPQSVGLYRMLSATVLQHGRDRHLLQNASAGAANFKRARAAEPENEYSLVYVRHLPLRRRLGWQVVKFLANRIALPLVIRNRL